MPSGWWNAHKKTVGGIEPMHVEMADSIRHWTKGGELFHRFDMVSDHAMQTINVRYVLQVDLGNLSPCASGCYINNSIESIRFS